MNNFFKETVDNLGLGVCRVNNDKKITYWNKGAFEITGLDEKEIIGNKLSFWNENCPVEMTLLDGEVRESNSVIAVSYTHLTLPTIYSV